MCMWPRIFPFDPDPDKLRDKNRRAKEILDYFNVNPAIGGNLYYLAVFYEFNKAEDHMPADNIVSLLRQGVVEQHDAACAARLLFHHIEPCKLNNGLPDYDCDAGIATVLNIIKKKTIFELCDHKAKTMPQCI